MNMTSSLAVRDDAIKQERHAARLIAIAADIAEEMIAGARSAEEVETIVRRLKSYQPIVPDRVSGQGGA